MEFLDKLVCKDYTQTTLFLNSKITLKIFGFKPDSINKSSRIQLLEYKKTDLTIFGFFYEFL
jgi:hypothetical protein